MNLIGSHQDEEVSFWWRLFGAEDGRLGVELLQHGSGRRGVPHAVVRRPSGHGQKRLGLRHEAYGGRPMLVTAETRRGTPPAQRYLGSPGSSAICPGLLGGCLS